MAEMRIEIIKVSKPEKVKKYEQIEVTYRDLSNDGKVSGKRLVSFGDYKHVYDIVRNLQEGDLATVNYEKVDGYWTWVSINTDQQGEVKTVNNDKPAKQAWVPDEVRQRLIVRQSCLAQAVASEQGNAASIEDIFSRADRFVDWVFEVEAAPKAKKTKTKVEEVV